MNTEMKIFVGAACVAVIAASGWALADRWQAHKAMAEKAEFETWKAGCFKTLDDLAAGKASPEGQPTQAEIMTDCLWRGGQPMKDEINHRLVAAGGRPIQ